MRVMEVGSIRIARRPFAVFLVFAIGLALSVSSLQARPVGDGIDDFGDVLDLDIEEKTAFCIAYPDLGDSREARDSNRWQEVACSGVLIWGEHHPDMFFYWARIQFRSLFLRDQVHDRLREGAEKGSIKALTALGLMEYRRNDDEQAMLDIYERAAATGDPVAMAELGRYVGRLGYLLGHDSDRPADYERARELLEAASEMDYPLADYLLGRLHSGLRNRELAETYLRSAAEAGVRHAYDWLETMGYEVERPDDLLEFQLHVPWNAVMYRRPEHAPEGSWVHSNAAQE